MEFWFELKEEKKNASKYIFFVCSICNNIGIDILYLPKVCNMPEAHNKHKQTLKMLNSFHVNWKHIGISVVSMYEKRKKSTSTVTTSDFCSIESYKYNKKKKTKKGTM